MNISLSPAQLTRAQLGHAVDLGNNEVLYADRCGEQWRYTVVVDGVTNRVRYASAGLSAAHWAINASQEDYDDVLAR